MRKENFYEETTHIFETPEGPLRSPETLPCCPSQKDWGFCILSSSRTKSRGTSSTLVSTQESPKTTAYACLLSCSQCFFSWRRREVTTVPEKAEAVNTSKPEILYDLFGTVNHQGSLQSGHYVANVKVNDDWFRCNDQHISSSSEANVLLSDGAYILFYARRWA